MKNYYIIHALVYFFLLGLLFSCNNEAVEEKAKATNTFTNPILSGFYPDPSICRVGEDYYMVNSTFEWFPGIPLFHSKDLVNWEQLCYVLTRPSQLQLADGLKSSEGIFAPTIRCHDGTYYVITTCVECGGNFYVTSQNPEGPWSEPIWLNDAVGFDPSLFWDEDGSCWYTGAANLKEQKDYEGQNGVYIQKLDLKSKKLVGEPTQLTFGHAVNAVWQEGPHLFKIKDRYMLLSAEGGTAFNHAITVFESKSITGPYIPSQINPVFTHRHLGKEYPITSVGHSDIIQTQKGAWWAVMLAVRPKEGINHLGRETFLVPLKFENGWPVFNPGIGKINIEEQRPDLAEFNAKKIAVRDDFEGDRLSLIWSQLHTQASEWYKLVGGRLQMTVRAETTKELKNPSMLVRRIQHFNFDAKTEIGFDELTDGSECGLIVIHNEKQQFRFAVIKEAEQFKLKLFQTDTGIDSLLFEQEFQGEKTILGLKANTYNFQFYSETEDGNVTLAGEVADGRIVSSGRVWSFTGPFIGVYATGNGYQTDTKIYFNWFEYSGF